SGDAKHALELLSGLSFMPRPALLESDADLASVRQLPGFPELVRKLRTAKREHHREARRAAAQASDAGEGPDLLHQRKDRAKGGKGIEVTNSVRRRLYHR